MPKIHRLRLPPSTLLLLYTDGVIERDRRPLHGLADLLNAAIFAYNFSQLPTAAVVERQMLLTGQNRDDAAILAAWAPPAYL
jgi:serine phosphatase RsbU (regulator of sigma subunit)